MIDFPPPHHMKIFGTIDEMKEARSRLGSPGTLDEALTATGIDAMFHLLDEGTIEIEGKTYRLIEIE